MVAVDTHMATVVAHSGGEIDGEEKTTKVASPEPGLIVKEAWCADVTQKDGLPETKL